MWNSNKSITLSLIVCFAVAVLLTVGIVLLPIMLKMYFGSFEITYDHRLFLMYRSVLSCYYVCLLPAYTAIYSLVKILFSLRREEIFTDSNIRRLRVLSWCCFVVALVTAVGFIFYRPLMAVALAAGFIGLILRVVKNVMCSAKILREENDLTI